MAAFREVEGRRRASGHGPWHLVHSQTFEGDMRQGFALDVWNILDQVMAGPSHRRPRFVPFGLDSDEIWTLMERHRIQNWISSQFPETEGGSEQQQAAAPVDIKGILAKCRTETFDPRGVGGEEEEEELHCPVCLDKFVASQTLLSLPCEHAFHTDCLKPWIESSHGCCPVCRFDILLGTPRTRPPVVQARASSSSPSVHVESTIDLRRNTEEKKEEKAEKDEQKGKEEEREAIKVEVEVEVKAKVESQAEVKIQAEAEIQAEVEAEVKVEPEIESESESESEPEPEPEPKVESEPEPEPESESESEFESESEVEIEVEVEAEAEAEVPFEEEVLFEEEEVPFMEEWMDFHQRGSDDLMSLFEGLESALDRMGLRG